MPQNFLQETVSVTPKCIRLFCSPFPKIPKFDKKSFFFPSFLFPKSVPSPSQRNPKISLEISSLFFPILFFPNHFSPTPIPFIFSPNFPKSAGLCISVGSPLLYLCRHLLSSILKEDLRVYRLQNMEGNGNEQPKCQRSFDHRGRKNNCWEFVIQILLFREREMVGSNEINLNECKSRGLTRDGTGVHDSIVNQLLTKIDGVESLNNVLLSGMTNRNDLLDEALLRPGRLEVQVEISLPDENGHLQILQIHTNKMKENSFLAPDVNLQELV
ncbi:uncharacterized protein LOC108480654 isoform X2 [Gossypium arboreum]|uniref:uncharacterized protein LOC108480654 isoform X2 n=1 Tax=Gossypium arboreum TaxID=29729 RepID=UPI0022F178C3|nr:uncharacterized protein LOC108480654 isoform X2 [Gossypium arboreum]